MGHKQISVTLPEELHPLVKMIAERTKTGESIAVVLPEVTKGLGIGQAARSPLAGLSAWRRWLLHLLLPAELRTLLR